MNHVVVLGAILSSFSVLPISFIIFKRKAVQSLDQCFKGQVWTCSAVQLGLWAVIGLWVILALPIADLLTFNINAKFLACGQGNLDTCVQSYLGVLTSQNSCVWFLVVFYNILSLKGALLLLNVFENLKDGKSAGTRIISYE